MLEYQTLIKNENTKLEDSIKKITNSRSWKYTKPLRNFKKKLLNK